MINFTHHPAPPILALYLLDPEYSDTDNFDFADLDLGSGPGGSPGHSLFPEQRLATSCGCIDDALAGGFSYGQINSIAADSADASTERSLVCDVYQPEYRDQKKPNHSRSR